MIDSDFIKKVKEANDIVDVVKEYLTLYKAGINYKAVCPFHDDHTPSLIVSKTRQTYKCFVCGEGGDVVDFVQKKEGWTFIEALHWLAQRGNVEWPKEQATDEDLARYKRRESQLIALTATQEFFAGELHQAESFLQARGYTSTDPILKEYGVGYAPAGSVAVKALQKLGYNADLLVEVGVAARSQEHGDLYDVFRDRLMFPFYDLHGKVIGFSGRQVTPNERSGKYVNTGETPVFTKGRNLYGLYQARQAVASRGFAYLVEGQFDVMSLARYGVRNVIGGSGTAFTDDQLRLLLRYTTEVRVIYDADNAGIKAAAKNTLLLLKAGLKVKCIRLPKGMDPDDFASKNQENTGKMLLDMAESFPYAFRRLLVPRGCKDEVTINDALGTIAQMIAAVDDSTLRLEYIKTTAKDFDTKMDAVELKVRANRANLGDTAPGTEMKPGLYGLDTLKDRLEPDQPAILTSDLQYFMQQLDDEPAVLVSGLISDNDVMKLRTLCGFFTASSSGCSVSGDGVPSPYLESLCRMFRGGISKITVVDGEEAESLIDFYIRQMGIFLKSYNGGSRVEIITRCIELTTYAEDAVVTVNRNRYCSHLGLTKGQFDDIRKPLATARKAAMKVNVQTDAMDNIVALADSLAADELPQYVTDTPEYAEMYKQYQFFPVLNKNGDPVCYMFDNKNSNGRSIVGDFYMTPLLHVFDDNYENNKRILRVNRRYYNTPVYIEVQSRDLLKMSTIESVLINYEAVNFTNGEEWKWRRIKEYMSRHYTMCTEIQVYGNQQTTGSSRVADEQFFAFANGIAHFVGNDYVFEPVNELGVVTHNNKNYYLPAFSTIYAGGGTKKERYENTRQLVYREVPAEKRVTFSEWASLMNDVYRINDNGKWATIFAILCAFRVNVHGLGRLFTAPFFMGPTGSGKTQIALSIRSLFMSPKEPILNLTQDTDQAVIKYMEVFRDVPVVLDEYNNTVISDIKFQALKSIVYDGESRKKSRANTSKEVESSKVYTPVVICGQETPQRDDNALMTRVIVCEVPSARHRTREQVARFERLKTIEDPDEVGLSNVLMRILKLRPVVMDHFRELRDKAYEDLKAGRVSSGEIDRLTRTVSLFVAIVYLLEDYAPDMKLPFTSGEFLEIAQRKIDMQMRMIRTTDKLAQFFSALGNLIDDGKVVYGRDFDIVEGNGKAATIFDARGERTSYTLELGHKYMYIRFASVFNAYNRSGYNTERSTDSTLEQNLRSHQSYIGTTKSRRFKWEETVEEPDSDNKMVRMVRRMERVSSATVLDYEVFRQVYDTDLMRESSPADENATQGDNTNQNTAATNDARENKEPVEGNLPFDPEHPEKGGFF